MEQFNSGELNFIFEINSSQVQHWSDERWKSCLAAGGGSKKEDISIALIILEQFFTSVLFRDTQDEVSLILRYRKMY